MTSLVSIDDEPPQTKKPTRRYTRIRDQVVEVTMPEFEPTCYPDRLETRQAPLLPPSTNATFISVTDLPWLIQWCKDEHRSGGVSVAEAAMNEDGPPKDLKTNCECEGVHFRWDFSGSWEAIILDGEHKGTTVKSSVAQLTEEEFLSAGGTGFKDASFDQLRTAAFAFLVDGVKKKLGRA